MNPEITVTARWLERAGRPWFPVTGEIHFSRLPRGRWSEVLGHARAGGLDAVATYVFWNAHEPEPGQFRWEGNRDLRAFVELAAEHGLGVVLRLGPWAHGESRYGGFPDWLVARGLPVRTNDPAYLDLVRAFYGETIAQLTGLAHHEGGPIFAAQVDNELYDRPEHLVTLRDLAEELGLDLPIWTATGWGGAQVPDSLLPVYGAYADGFWDDSETEWPAFAPIHFRYSEVRDDLTVGADLREAIDGMEAGAVPVRPELPFATCELGGGMHVAYHRRPLVTPEDVAALALAKIGSGSIWQGYYMYAGGTQRVGPHGTEQESQATGYPNDVPALSYDFHAPIGEHGQIRSHHHLLRRQHLWLHEEGPRLATMTTTIGGGSDDPEELRWAVRSDGRSGYLFLTTYQPAKRPLAAQPGVQVTVDFDDGPVTVPSRPVDLPSGISVAWPLHHRLTPDRELRSATAQLVTRISDDAGDLVVLAALDSVPVELVVDSAAGTKVIEPDTAPGPVCVIDLPGVRVLILDEATANRLYRLPVAGRDRLVLSDAPVYAEGGDLVLHPDTDRSTIAMFPPVALSGAGEPRDEGLWRTWEVAAPDAGTTILAADLRPEHGPPPTPRRGGPMDRLSVPVDYSGAARIRVDVPDSAFTADRTLLRVTWTGDTGRAFAGGALIGDHFWHGRTWDLDLTPHAAMIGEHGLTLELLPWRRATGVWVDPAVRDLPDGITVDAIAIVNVAKIRLRPEPA